MPMRAAAPFSWWDLGSDSALLPAQFAEIMMKIEEYISKQAKASEGANTERPQTSTDDKMTLCFPVSLRSTLVSFSEAKAKKRRGSGCSP